MSPPPTPLLGRFSVDPPAGPVVTVAGTALSAEDLLDRACGVAARLTGMPAVAVLTDPDVDTVVAVLAGLLAGVPVVPVPPDAGPAELAHLLGDCRAPVLLAGRTPAGCTVPVLPVTPAPGTHPTPGEPATDRPALVVYTSGTTGPPKGAVHTRASLAAGLDSLIQAWAWTAEDTLVHGLPLFHVHGLVLGVLGALRTGSPLVHVGAVSPTAYLATKGTMYFGVPTLWARLLRAGGDTTHLRAARLLVSGSAALPVPVFEGLHARTGHHVLERYGMTETLITLTNPLQGPRRPGWVGVPLPRVQTRLVDEAGEAVPAGADQPGHLCVRGPMLFQGYLNRPGATAQTVDAQGWLHTGDVAVVAGDWHRIVGRAGTDLISSGGYRIGAGEVENALLAHPGVAEAAVLGLPHPDLGEQVTAFVVADGVDEQRLIAFVAAHLSAHKRPRRIVFVEALPKNAMGKTVKARLRDQA